MGRCVAVEKIWNYLAHFKRRIFARDSMSRPAKKAESLSIFVEEAIDNLHGSRTSEV